MGKLEFVSRSETFESTSYGLHVNHLCVVLPGGPIAGVWGVQSPNGRGLGDWKANHSTWQEILDTCQTWGRGLDI